MSEGKKWVQPQLGLVQSKSQLWQCSGGVSGTVPSGEFKTEPDDLSFDVSLWGSD